MTPREQGFLLLTSSLGDPARKALTLRQFRTLILRAKDLPGLQNATCVTLEDMAAMGYDSAMAERVVTLFSEKERMAAYLRLARRQGCRLIALSNDHYPPLMPNRLGYDAPTVLWAKGEESLLQKPAIALVGSRELSPDNREFARAVGRRAAEQDFVLVSGNARGADREAQDACLAHGGQVISVIPDRLTDQPTKENILYLSEDSFDLGFSTSRALRRNRIIHSLGIKTYVAQSAYGKGGTWDGTTKNLKNGWSPVYCYDDHSEAVRELIALGAEPVRDI